MEDQLAKALKDAMDWINHGIPESCGKCGSPNANCDGLCVEASYFSADYASWSKLLETYRKSRG